MAERELAPVVRHHLDELTSDLGIWQHAIGTVPDPANGTCTDDVARALLIDLAHARAIGWQEVRASAWRSLRYLRDAWNPAPATFRNFRDAGGGWLDEGGSDDCQGRVLLVLGIALREPHEPAFTADARLLFGVALPTAGRRHALRAMSSTMVGLTAALAGTALTGATRAATEARLRRLAGRLQGAFTLHPTDPGWPWPEPVVTYENALLPHALIAAGGHLGDPAMLRLGLSTLDWLLAEQRAPDGWFSPIGNGWWPRDGARSRFDQQPIEATATLLACGAALEQTGDARYTEAIERCYGWFLGDNDAHLTVAMPATGGCGDGLAPGRVSVNQGAESTLMWLLAVEGVREARLAARSPALAGTA